MIIIIATIIIIITFNYNYVDVPYLSEVWVDCTLIFDFSLDEGITHKLFNLLSVGNNNTE